MPNEMPSIKQQQRTRIEEPRRYRVFFLNDDFTTMEFVVMVLQQVFFKDTREAYGLMFKVHHEGKACVGIYPYDIARSKADKAIRIARENGYPLRITVEPE